MQAPSFRSRSAARDRQPSGMRTGGPRNLLGVNVCHTLRTLKGILMPKLKLLAAAPALSIRSLANASALVNLQILGSTSQSGPYGSSLSGLTSGETIFVEVVGAMAPVGTANTTGGTITSLDPTKDGISSLKFDLTASDTPSWIT